MSDGIGKRYITVKGVTYIIGGPMDVGFPPEHPEYVNYKKLSKELLSVVGTIKNINWFLLYKFVVVCFWDGNYIF